MSVLEQLFVDSRFWGAILILINAILYYFMPDFPKAIWAGIDGVAAVIIGSLAVQQSRVRAAGK